MTGSREMKISEFKQSVAGDAPPAEVTDLGLQALWFAAKGKWDHAHELAQADKGKSGDWVHAYLHRAEGDLSNAKYWYRRAGKPVHTGDLPAEWDEIIASLL